MMVPHAHVIGDPIGHSKSPLIHRYWLDRLGLDGWYDAIHVTPADLPRYVAEQRERLDWRGCNVTIPHKLAVMELVDDPGDVRSSIGAMNTILRQLDGSVIGTNTDAAGFFAPLTALDLAGMPVAVVGTGGAAHAVLFALARANVGPVSMIARSPLKGAAILSRFGLQGSVLSIDAPVPSAGLLVNTTSLGMAGQPGYSPDLKRLLPGAIVYDLVYAPVDTPLLHAARAQGLDTIDGLEMLVSQAAVAFELFFGSPAPREHDDALRALLLA